MIRFIFVICSLFVMNVSVFGQNALDKDLDKSFHKYNLVELDNKVVLEKAKSEQPIEFQAYGPTRGVKRKCSNFRAAI